MSMALRWNDMESFKEHDRLIRMFRRSHASAPEVRHALIQSMPTLHIIYPMRETGGSRHLSSTARWSTLIPLWKVRLPKFSQN